MASILSDLLNRIEIIEHYGNLNIQISGITDDSREIKDKNVFVCMPAVYESPYAKWTYRTDGHDYIPNAIDNGASAIIVQKPLREINIKDGITYVRVNDTRTALSKVSARFYDYPSRKLLMVGVTGTNGKTSTCYLSRSVLTSGGKKTAILGTIVQRIGGKDISASMTTFEAHRLQKILGDIVDEGMDAVVMEASSHAIELKRVDEVDFDVAVFTNLTQDHLDFHKGMEGYLASKIKLFAGLGTYKNPVYAVINADDPASDKIVHNTKAKVITYAVNDNADIKVKTYQSTSQGLSFVVSVYNKDDIEINLQLLGDYNLYNALSAIGVGVSQGLSLDIIKKGLEQVDSVPGRFDRVNCGQDFTVVVDYAHTPDALERVLTAARKLTEGRLITVFGCGGDRDKTKRPIMGKTATSLSDYAIVTSDNPRTEDPMQIISHILDGINSGEYEVIPDRRSAIKRAISIAKSGDFIVIAGKGHENYQIIGTNKIHFDDKEVASEFLREMKDGKF
ncbi:MAG: UDP-N-acetylmuramoyl-L-alanyl-D-glutamate--2,6-diaminopimelate ligase [Candidatus Poribacteria bacterium]